jgi:hypothetical protein
MHLRAGSKDPRARSLPRGWGRLACNAGRLLGSASGFRPSRGRESDPRRRSGELTRSTWQAFIGVLRLGPAGPMEVAMVYRCGGFGLSEPFQRQAPSLLARSAIHYTYSGCRRAGRSNDLPPGATLELAVGLLVAPRPGARRVRFGQAVCRQGATATARGIQPAVLLMRPACLLGCLKLARSRASDSAMLERCVHPPGCRQQAAGGRPTELRRLVGSACARKRSLDLGGRAAYYVLGLLCSPSGLISPSVRSTVALRKRRQPVTA